MRAVTAPASRMRSPVQIQARLPLVVTAVMLACILPEVLLQGADWGLWGTGRWRAIGYNWGGFWTGLLRDWQPNFALQPYAMFLTYGFLHAGPVHLAVNMLTLAALGRMVAARAGAGGFAAIYGAAVLGGAAVFAALSTAPQPMVGASGALFGLAGALTLWDHRAAPPGRRRWLRLARTLGGLVALNLLMWATTGGTIAWQTHLGGFLAGALVAAGLAPRHPATATG